MKIFYCPTIPLYFFNFVRSLIMASEAGSSVLAPSTTQVSSQSKSKKTKDGSTVWKDHCCTARDTEDPKKKYCNYCTKESRDPIYGSDNSSNMRKHIEEIHHIEVKLATSKIQQVALEQLRELYRQAEAVGETSKINTQVLRKHLNQDVINEALVSLIVVQNLAFASVEWPKLYTLC
jgi:hypothetical protein